MNKSIIYILLLLAGSKVAHAQIPNADFEQGVMGAIPHWTALNEVNLTNAAQSGHQALFFKPTQDQDNVDLLTTGTFDVPFVALNPKVDATAFRFWYKGDFATNERLYVNVQLKKGNNIYAVGAAEFHVSQMDYTQATLPLFRAPFMNTADSIAITFNIRSQGGVGLTGATEILVDNLSLLNTSSTSVEDKMASPELHLYQSASSVQIKITGSSTKEGEMEIIDLTGKVVYNGKVEDGKEESVQTNGWPKGIYVVRIKAGHNRLCKKIMV